MKFKGLEKDRGKDLDFATHGFRIQSPCGRTYVVALEAVRDDYAHFISKTDKVSYEKALEGVSSSDVESWFHDQFTWEDVERLGECVARPAHTPEQIALIVEAALNSTRDRSSPQSQAVLQVLEDRLSRQSSARLEESIPPPSVSVHKPPRM